MKKTKMNKNIFRISIGVSIVFIALFVAAAVFIIVNLKPITYTRGAGTQFNGFSWKGTIFIETSVFISEDDVTLDTETQTVIYKTPVNPDKIKEDTQNEVTLLLTTEHDKEKTIFESEIKALNTEIAELEKQLAELEEKCVGLEEENEKLNKQLSQYGKATQSSTGGTAIQSSGGTSKASSNTDSADKTSSGSSTSSGKTESAGGNASEAVSTTPEIDVSALISAAHGYAAGKNMGVNGGLAIGSAGFENPIETSGMTADYITQHLNYQIDNIHSMWKAIPEYDPDTVIPCYNIVKSGTLIYVLYG